ncbi:MAG: beta-hydroxyacyl-ACP dehydratase [Polaromonas sp.]|nr:beta-hydroxyacyl-ACP dehydratase [Polaromonas sp.]
MTGSCYSSRVDIPADHPAFAGHFPGQPILPGVLLLERIMALAQTHLVQLGEGCALRNVKFLAAVAPGDQLRLDLSHTGRSQYNFNAVIVRTEGLPAVVACSGQLRLAYSDGLQG